MLRYVLPARETTPGAVGPAVRDQEPGRLFLGEPEGETGGLIGAVELPNIVHMAYEDELDG